jgi:hypothetical protein
VLPVRPFQETAGPSPLLLERTPALGPLRKRGARSQHHTGMSPMGGARLERRPPACKARAAAAVCCGLWPRPPRSDGLAPVRCLLLMFAASKPASRRSLLLSRESASAAGWPQPRPRCSSTGAGTRCRRHARPSRAARPRPRYRRPPTRTQSSTSATERERARLSTRLGGAEWLGVEPLGRPAERGHVHTVSYRSVRSPVRTSSEKSSGCSQAAKCPPLSSWL